MVGSRKPTARGTSISFETASATARPEREAWRQRRSRRRRFSSSGEASRLSERRVRKLRPGVAVERAQGQEAAAERREAESGDREPDGDERKAGEFEIVTGDRPAKIGQ